MVSKVIFLRIFFTKLFLGIFILFTFFVPFVSASDITSTNFIIRDPVIGTTGGYGTSASFNLISNGETLFTDINSSASFIGQYGFLYYKDATPPVVTPPGGGGGGGEPYPPFYPGLECETKTADLNCDGLVNIEDLSILLYYFTHTTDKLALYDFSGDGVLDIKDISIMFYYWDL